MANQRSFGITRIAPAFGINPGDLVSLKNNRCELFVSGDDFFGLALGFDGQFANVACERFRPFVTAVDDTYVVGDFVAADTGNKFKKVASAALGDAIVTQVNSNTSLEVEFFGPKTIRNATRGDFALTFDNDITYNNGETLEEDALWEVFKG